MLFEKIILNRVVQNTRRLRLCRFPLGACLSFLLLLQEGLSSLDKCALVQPPANAQESLLDPGKPSVRPPRYYVRDSRAGCQGRRAQY